MNLKQDIGRQIHDIRKMRGMTQTTLATLIGTTQDHISEIEAGNVNITMDYLLNIAKALDINIVIKLNLK